MTLQDYVGVPRKGWREVGLEHPLLAVQGGSHQGTAINQLRLCGQ